MSHILVGFSTKRDDWISRLICWFTRWRHSHVVLVNAAQTRIVESTSFPFQDPEDGEMRDGPTEDQIRAERIRLGIIDARKERTQVLKKAQKVEKGSEQAQELRLYAYLLKSEIDRLQAEYEALKAELEQQGAIIRSAVITRMVMAMLEEEIRQARQEEDDIAFLLAMLAEI